MIGTGFASPLIGMTYVSKPVAPPKSAKNSSRLGFDRICAGIRLDAVPKNRCGTLVPSAFLANSPSCVDS
jgi:hypothetical protein